MASPSKRVVRFKLPTSSSTSEDEQEVESKFAIVARKMKRPMAEEEDNCDLISTEVKRAKSDIATTSEHEQKKKINIRCSVAKVVDLIAEIKKNERQVEAVNAMGFKSMFELPLVRFNTDLVIFLINNFDPNACRLNIRNEQIHISDIDVHLIFGLPLRSGLDVELFGRNKTEVEEEYVNRSLHCLGNNIPNSETVKENLLKDIEGGESFKRNFMVYLVSNLIAPLGNSRQVNWRVLKSLKETSTIKEFNWCNFLLIELCKRVREYKARDDQNTRNVGGCILFLEFFYLDRVQHGGQPTIKRNCTKPRMIGWNNEIIKERIRKELREAKSFGFGKIVDDPLYRIIQAEREELVVKGKRNEETRGGKENGNEDRELNRFGELIDEVINASHAVQIANKNLLGKIKKIQKEFPSQTVSICDYLKIKAPAVLEK